MYTNLILNIMHWLHNIHYYIKKPVIHIINEKSKLLTYLHIIRIVILSYQINTI